MSTGEVRKRFVFHGRVQGVGFRYSAAHLARSLELTGWVTNEWDGTVLMEVQGREGLIDKLLQRINARPFIEIDWIDESCIPMQPESGFSIK